MDTGVVDQDLDRTIAQHRFQRDTHRGRIGDIEAKCLRPPSRRHDLLRNRFSNRLAAVGMHKYLMPVGGKPSADRRADSTAAASHEGSFRRWAHASIPCARGALNTIVARPASRARSPPDTKKSYSTLRSSPFTNSAVAIKSASMSSRRLVCSETFRTLAR